MYVFWIGTGDEESLHVEEVNRIFLYMIPFARCFFFFFFKDRAPPEISPLPLPAALPICSPIIGGSRRPVGGTPPVRRAVSSGHSEPPVPETDEHRQRHDEEHQAEDDTRFGVRRFERQVDRKSTRLNSSHLVISYAVFCLK